MKTRKVRVICIQLPSLVYLPWRDEECLAELPVIGNTYLARAFRVGEDLMECITPEHGDETDRGFLVPSYWFHRSFRSEEVIEL